MKRLFATLLLLACPAWADVTHECIELLDDSTLDDSVTTDIVQLENLDAQAITLAAFATNSAGTNPTLNISFQSCFSTDTETCSTISSFDECTTACWGGDGQQYLSLNKDLTNLFPYVRVVATLGGTASPEYDAEVYLCIK